MSVCVFQRAFPRNILCPDTVNAMPFLSKLLCERAVLHMVGSLEATLISNHWMPGPVLPSVTTRSVSRHCQMSQVGWWERQVIVKPLPGENQRSSTSSPLSKMAVCFQKLEAEFFLGTPQFHNPQGQKAQDMAWSWRSENVLALPKIVE